MGLIYYAVGNLFFQIFLSVLLISLICRHNPDDQRSVIFQRLIYACLMWAAFDFLMILNQKFLQPETAFRLYGVLSFMFLVFPPIAIQLVLCLIRELRGSEKALIFMPYILLYLVILVFPEFSSAATFGIPGGFEGSLPPWNTVFKGLSLGLPLVCVGILLHSSSKDTDRIIQKEKRILSLGAILFMAGILISQAVVQIKPGLPWFANLSTAFYSIAAYIALKRYGRILSSRAIYETTVKISPNGISHVSDRRMVWMNKSMILLLNMKEMEPVDIGDILHENQPSGTSREEIIDGIASGSLRGKVVYIRDGIQDFRACLVNCAPLESDRPESGLLLILTDVSEENRIKKELVDLNLKLEEMAHVDSLTQIPNRRRFDQVLSLEWHRAARSGRPLSLVLLDIDYFKKYNDLYGHGNGDVCLTEVARAIAAEARRPADLACRIGGEEFCVILPDTPLAGAHDIAEKIRSGVESVNIPHEDSGVSDHITVSIGVCCADRFSGTSRSKLIQAADKALYKAKQAGRNRIEAAPLLAGPPEK